MGDWSVRTRKVSIARKWVVEAGGKFDFLFRGLRLPCRPWPRDVKYAWVSELCNNIALESVIVLDDGFERWG